MRLEMCQLRGNGEGRVGIQSEMERLSGVIGSLLKCLINASLRECMDG